MPVDVATRLWQSMREIRGRHPDVRWLPQEKLHLTLVFLGATDPAHLPALGAAIESVAATTRAFHVLTGDGGGRVGGRRGGVAWLRIARGAADVAQLARDLEDALGSKVYDDQMVPRPHLTLARRATEAAVADVQDAANAISVGWRVDQIVLFRSHTGPGGSRYEELASTPLRGT